MSLEKFEPDLSQKDEIDLVYQQYICNKKEQRDALYNEFISGPIWNNDLIRGHYEETNTEPNDPNIPEKKLMCIIKDILIFPELYLDIPDMQLEKLYTIINGHNDFEILFMSSGKKITKTHGSIAIGCKRLESGISISGVGDPTRIKMKLPKEFKNKLIQMLQQPEIIFNAEVENQFGNKEKIIKSFETEEYFDSRAIYMLFQGCSIQEKSPEIASNTITEMRKQFNMLVFKYDFMNKQVNAIHQELWTKPRLVQQNTDTEHFNGFYKTHLKERRQSRGFGALFHPITRSIALRHQSHVQAADPIRNFLYFEREKVKRDQKRGIGYLFKTQDIWTYGGTLNLRENTSECVGFATRLLGAIPIVASFINKFSRNGLQITTDSEAEKQREAMDAFSNLSTPTLCFGHLNQSANIRDGKHSKFKSSGAGAGIVYDLSITKFFAIGFGPIKEHVWGFVVTDINGILLPKDQWKPGWISKEKIKNSLLTSDTILEMIGSASTQRDSKQADLRFKMGEHVTFREPYDQNKFEVTERPAQSSPELQQLSFQDGTSFMLGSHIATIIEGKIHWNGHQFNARDYKGHLILIPNKTMYDWLEQRCIVKMDVEGYPTSIKETVVFGTATDKYPLYPDLLGFMPRRNISREVDGWLKKKDEYAARQRALNPDREKLLGQQLLVSHPVTYAKNFLKNRMDEICEKCALQVKHAPRKLMINQFIHNHDDFILAFLRGSQGIVSEGDRPNNVNRPRPVHITDHELYRAFSGKHRKEILDSMHFADENLVFDAPSKANKMCYNPIHLFYHRELGLRHEDEFVSPFKLD